MKVLVTGAGGMLGREVVKAAQDAWRAMPVKPGGVFCVYADRAQLDVTDPGAVRGFLSEHPVQVVINCAGMTRHRDPEPRPDEYRRVNTYAPIMLAAECDRVDARLIHVSTDCVFSGRRPLEAGPYYEDDEPDATDAYGDSKAMGEVFGAPHLTVRTSFVGLGDRGLIADLRRNGQLATRRWPLWRNAIWSGSTAPAVARALVKLAQRPDVTGVMHMAGDWITKAQLCYAIWSAGLAVDAGSEETPEPVVNRWLASRRNDVPSLPALSDALKELVR